ncbi:MAG: CDP-alcohol phosphatidyltransferase family protein [Anaerolineaceae bacterium]
MEHKRMSLSDHMRVIFKGVLDPIGGWLNSLGIHPNTMTILGLIGNLVASVLVAFGYIQLGGIIYLANGLFDVLDGTMARLRGSTSVFGAYLDSVSDRYADLAILLGLLVYYMGQDNWLAAILIFCAAGGSVMVSYTKARAEGLGLTAKVGMLTRFERYLIIALGLAFNVPMAMLWVISILANFTALQRFWHVYRQTRTQPDDQPSLQAGKG